MKTWIVICITVFLLLLCSQLISGYLLTSTYLPGRAPVSSGDMFLLFQTGVVGTGLWAIYRVSQKRKGVTE